MNDKELLESLIAQARKNGYISGFTEAMTVVNESLERTRNKNMSDGERIMELLQNLLNASLKNHD